MIAVAGCTAAEAANRLERLIVPELGPVVLQTNQVAIGNFDGAALLTIAINWSLCQTSNWEMAGPMDRAILTASAASRASIRSSKIPGQMTL